MRSSSVRLSSGEHSPVSLAAAEDDDDDDDDDEEEERVSDEEHVIPPATVCADEVSVVEKTDKGC